MVHPPRSAAVGVVSTLLAGIFSTEIVRTATQSRANGAMSSFPPVPGKEIGTPPRRLWHGRYTSSCSTLQRRLQPAAARPGWTDPIERLFQRISDACYSRSGLPTGMMRRGSSPSRPKIFFTPLSEKAPTVADARCKAAAWRCRLWDA